MLDSNDKTEIVTLSHLYKKCSALGIYNRVEILHPIPQGSAEKLRLSAEKLTQDPRFFPLEKRPFAQFSASAA